MQHRLNNQEKQELVEKYKTGGFTCKDLSVFYKISIPAITGLLRRRGIEINNNQSQLQRKYTLNESYFDEINTEAKAYFLGLLYADGYNNEERNCVQISLQEQDREILERFNIELESNKPLSFINKQKYNKNHQNQYRLSIYSEKVSTRIKNLGCPQKKSLILEFPDKNIIPENLLKHFIRGYFDGDGSFGTYLSKGKYKKYFFVFVGTKNFCEKLQKIIKEKFDINSSIEIRHKDRDNSTRQLRFSGRIQIYKILDWLYFNSSFFLRRKFEKYIISNS